jgi:hypothetical protein
MFTPLKVFSMAQNPIRRTPAAKVSDRRLKLDGIPPDDGAVVPLRQPPGQHDRDPRRKLPEAGPTVLHLQISCVHSIKN